MDLRLVDLRVREVMPAALTHPEPDEITPPPPHRTSLWLVAALFAALLTIGGLWLWMRKRRVKNDGGNAARGS